MSFLVGAEKDSGVEKIAGKENCENHSKGWHLKKEGEKKRVCGSSLEEEEPGKGGKGESK